MAVERTPLTYAFAAWEGAGRGHRARAAALMEVLERDFDAVAHELERPAEQYAPTRGGLLIVDAPAGSEALRTPGLDVAFLDTPVRTTAPIRVWPGAAGAKNAAADPSEVSAAAILAGPAFTPLRLAIVRTVRATEEGRAGRRAQAVAAGKPAPDERSGVVDLRELDGSVGPLAVAGRLLAARVAIVNGGLRAAEAAFAGCALVMVPEGPGEVAQASTLATVGAGVVETAASAAGTARAMEADVGRAAAHAVVARSVFDGRGVERLMIAIIGYSAGVRADVLPAPPRRPVEARRRRLPRRPR